MNLDTLVVTLVLSSYLVAALATFAGYGQANLGYARDKKASGRLGPFTKQSDWFLRLSTIAIAFVSLISDHAGLLRFHHSLMMTAIGAIVILCGSAVFVWSLRSLGDNYSPCFDAYVPNHLCHTGPYALIRHPIYTANLLVVAGTALTSGSFWLVLVCAGYFVVYFVTARNEEQVLAKDLPGYASYRQNSFMFLPHPRFRRRTR